MMLNFNYEDSWLKTYYMARIKEDFFEERRSIPVTTTLSAVLSSSGTGSVINATASSASA
jgi:hypothetical protein